MLRSIGHFEVTVSNACSSASISAPSFAAISRSSFSSSSVPGDQFGFDRFQTRRQLPADLECVLCRAHLLG